MNILLYATANAGFVGAIALDWKAFSLCQLQAIDKEAYYKYVEMLNFCVIQLLKVSYYKCTAFVVTTEFSIKQISCKNKVRPE